MGGTASVEPPEQAAHPARRRPPGTTETLYFAYGSNLHIAQMAQRCPGSHFKGKATLAGWRWQINQRGVANVVSSSRCAVDGLVFSITPKDQRALDRSEGVARGFYQKQILRVCLEPHARFYDIKTSRLAEMPFSQTDIDGTSSAPAKAVVPPGDNHIPHGAESLDRSGDMAMFNTTEDGDLRRERQPPPVRHVKVLVYVSEGYKDDGTIREEYIARMRKAVADAAALGVPRAFLDKYIVPHLTEPGHAMSAASLGVTPASKRSNLIDNGKDTKRPEGENVRQDANPGPPGDDQPESQPRSTHAPGTASQVALHALQLKNREPSEDPRIPNFPVEMLEALQSSISGLESARNDRIAYVVVAKKMHTADGEGGFTIKATSQDPELANELAMKVFRDVFSNDSLRVKEEGGLEAGLPRPAGEARKPTRVIWDLDGRGCLHLRVGSHVNGPHISVWVEKQDLLVAV